jgi:archaellum biogenesis ATPase FlaH
MEFNDNSKKVRKLLKIGSPIQQLLDSLDDPVFGNLFMISGGSNSGKSIVAAKLLEHFTNKNNMCSYYDLEMAFPHTLKEYHFPKLKKKNFSLYSQRGIPINDLI